MLGKLYFIVAFLKEYSREYLFQGMLLVPRDATGVL